MDEQIHSIFGVSTFRFQHSSNTPGHALDEIDARLLWDLLPLVLHTLPQLVDAGRLGLVRCELSLEVTPQMLDRIQVWRLRRPFQHLDLVVFEPLTGEMGGVLGVVVLLEDDFFLLQLVELEGPEELVSEDVRVELCVLLPSMRHA